MNAHIADTRKGSRCKVKNARKVTGFFPLRRFGISGNGKKGFRDNQIPFRRGMRRDVFKGV
jgi:hypothetical protein